MENSPSSVFRPIPQFFMEPVSFSTKKDRNFTPRDRAPPAPKASTKKYLSLSRFSERKVLPRAQLVSFITKETSIIAPSYDPNKNETYYNQCFQKIAKLGTGSFGEVFEVKSKDDGRHYAIKKFKEKFKNSFDRTHKCEEVKKHEKLPLHKNCVKFIKAWEERENLFIQTELCKTSLHAYSIKHHDIEEKFVWNCLVDLLMGLKNLHDHNFVHLDIKPENVFLSKEDVCKLGDFGLVQDLSKKVIDGQEGDSKYLAPELLKGIFGKAADIFSLGITILEIASDLDLPQGEDLWHQLRSGNLPEEFLRGTSEELKFVIRWMMGPDHTLRPNVDQLLEHEYIKQIWKERNEDIDIEEQEIIPAAQPKISRGLLSAFDNVADDKKTNNSPSLTPKRTPVNQGSPHWHNCANSDSPLYEPSSDSEKDFIKNCESTFSDDEFPSTNLRGKGNLLKEKLCEEDEDEHHIGSPERKKLSF